MAPKPYVFGQRSSPFYPKIFLHPESDFDFYVNSTELRATRTQLDVLVTAGTLTYTELADEPTTPSGNGLDPFLLMGA